MSQSILFSSSFVLSLLTCSIQGLAHAATTGTNSTSTQCSTLSRLLPNEVSYPSSTTYTDSISSLYWTETRLSPACVVKPTSAEDVSTIVTALARIYSTNPAASLFAIRSGGHSPIAGANNDDDGVTIDLTSLNSAVISSDQKTISIGAGSIWSDIYAQLDSLNLTVVGGRVAGIGLGGLLTGGGISFFSPQYGWACDNIVGMDVVIANGSSIYTSASENADLFQAIKGGSNNFGVVTSFDLNVYEQGQFLGGWIFYDETTIPQHLQAFNDFMDPANFDPYASVIQSFVYEPTYGIQLVSMGMEYALPETDPVALQPFLNISGQIQSTMRISNLLEFVEEEAAFQPTGVRGIYVTTTFSSTLAVLTSVYDLWDATTTSVKDVSSIGYTLIFQRIPITVSEDTNSFGLPSNAGDFVLCLLSVTWANESDDELVNSVTKSLIEAIEEATKAAGVYQDFKYLNYAAEWQNPLGSYGTAGQENFLAVSKKYDPKGLFQTAVPGGFKLAALES